jgi:hypothetical protein
MIAEFGGTSVNNGLRGQIVDQREGAARRNARHSTAQWLCGHRTGHLLMTQGLQSGPLAILGGQNSARWLS